MTNGWKRQEDCNEKTKKGNAYYATKVALSINKTYRLIDILFSEVVRMACSIMNVLRVSQRATGSSLLEQGAKVRNFRTVYNFNYNCNFIK